ncbi:hypothetical protein CR513_23400, partial [Mucuna pruriens]
MIDNLRLENQLIELTSLVRQLVVGQHQPSAQVKFCGICTSVEHPTDICPMLLETKSNNAEIIGVIAVAVESESRAVYNLEIRTHGKFASNEPKQQQQQVPPQDNSPLMEEWMKHMNSKLKPKLIPVNAEYEPEADSQVQQQARVVPLPFPIWIVPTRKSETDEDLVNMFWRVEINISLLDSIKQILKYEKFLKELCMHNRKKLKAGVEMGGVVLVLIKNEEVTIGSQQVLPKKCRDLGTS